MHCSWSIFAEHCPMSVQLTVQHSKSFSVRTRNLIVDEIRISCYPLPRKSSRHKPLIHPITIPLCLGNDLCCAVAQPVEESACEAGRINASVRRAKSPDVVCCQRQSRKAFRSNVHIVITLRNVVVAVIVSILADRLNFQRNTCVVIWAENTNLIRLRFMRTLAEKELHVSISSADDIFHPRRALSIGPGTLLMAGHDRNQFSHLTLRPLIRASGACAYSVHIDEKNVPL